MCKTSSTCNVETCKKGCGRKGSTEDQNVDSTPFAVNPAALRTELKKTIDKEREKLRNKSEALDAAEASHDEVSDAIIKILLDEGSMAAMLAYGKNKDPKNQKGKQISERYKELQERMTPALREKVRKFVLETIKVQFKKDAKAAEKYMKETLDKLFPDFLPQFFKTHDYNKGKGPEK
ncbi:unnamed protein product [Calypogeia fissa]